MNNHELLHVMMMIVLLLMMMVVVTTMMKMILSPERESLVLSENNLLHKIKFNQQLERE